MEVSMSKERVWLAIALCLAIIATGCTKRENRILAKVGNTTVTVQDFDERWRPRSFDTPEEEMEAKREVLNDLINNRLMAVEAERRGLHENERL
jgi:type II secretory pathway component PulM